MKVIRFVSVAAAAAATFACLGEARAADVVSTTTSSGPNRSLLSSGIFAFGVPYVASVIVAGTSDHPGDRRLYVPVAGPWMDLADRSCPAGRTCDDGFNKGLLIVDGIFQGIGALDIVGAFLFPVTTTVTAARRPTPAVARFHVSPASVGTGYGVAAVGAF